MERLDLYEKKLFNFIIKYKKTLDKINNFFDFIVINFIIVFEKVLFLLASVIDKTSLFMRYTTFPIHWIWLKLQFKKEEEQKLTDLPLFQIGGHYIYGRPGAGKSTSVYHAMMDYAYLTGKTSYTTHMFELPRKDEYGRDYYHHQLFHPSEFFQEGTQVVELDTKKHNVITYEEMLTMYHQRNNKKSSHNDEILPLVSSMGGQRHQGIDLFFFISQLPSNDISLMQMIKWYHEVRIKKGFDYKHWLETGKFKFKIKGWWFESSLIVPNGRSDYKLEKPKKWFYECKYDEDMKYFNRLNLKAHYSNLPKHKGVEMKA